MARQEIDEESLKSRLRTYARTLNKYEQHINMMEKHLQAHAEHMRRLESMADELRSRLEETEGQFPASPGDEVTARRAGLDARLNDIKIKIPHE